MSKEDADIEINKGNYVTEEPGKGFLRVVAAPKPMDIVEIDASRALVDAGQIVIACGGGGIPVIFQNHNLKGASAVIEKDDIAGKLASELHADVLLILTGVPEVYTDFGTEKASPIPHMDTAQAEAYIKEGQFAETTMLPKINAAITYLTANPDGKVIITSMEYVKDAISGKAGTVITK